VNKLNHFFISKFNNYLPDEGDETKGFFLFNPPTGSGKTWATITYIANSLNSKSKRKIFFITNLKENLDKPFFDLKEQVEPKRILRLLSIEEELCRLCDEELWEEPKSYRFLWYTPFKESVEAYNKQKKKENLYDDYLVYLKKKYEEKEQKFKAEIYKKVDELKKGGDKSTLNQLKKELKKIYRTIDLTKDYNVIFLTTQKFLHQIYDPFLGSDYIYNMKEFKGNSICFIDEFDSQKNIFLGIEIDKFVEETKDYISIFLKIYAGLEHKRFFKKFEFQKELEELREHFSEINSKNNLQYSHKLEDDPSKTNILFKDIEYFSVDKRYYNLQVDKDRESNIIIQTEANEFNEVKDENLGLLNTLNDVIVSINYFISRINIVAQKYYKEHEDRLEFSNAISTVLNEVNIPKNDKIHSFLKDRILERNRIRGDNYYSDWSKNAFYDRGFRYFSFHNSIDFDTKTNIDFKVFDNTPEKILAEIAQHTFVVGISATALNQSVTSNFKLEYLRSKFPNNYFYLNGDELKELERLYIDAKKDKIENYQVEVIDYSIDSDNEYAFKSVAKELFDEDFEWWIEEHQNRYYINRYFKIVKAYLAFKQNCDIQSFLCLLTTYPKSEDEVDKYESGLNQEHLDILLQSALRKHNVEFDKTEPLYFIYDSKSQTQKEYETIIKDKLKNGDKVFVISTYQGLGIGKNIQYEVLDNNAEVVEKDFDAIYLDKPTYLLERISGDKQEMENEKSLIKYIYQLETLYTDMQIGRKELEKSIKSAFNTTFNQVPFKDAFRHSTSEDYIHSASKIIIQAIGRLHRTRVSSKKYIFVDKNLSFLNFYRDSNSFNLLSFEALIRHIQLFHSDKVKRVWSDNQMVNEKNFKIRGVIEDSLQILNSYQSLKNEKRVQEWQDIREFVLKNPTLKEITTEMEEKYEQFYFKYKNNSENRQLKYFYRQENDYRYIEISWEYQSGYIEVSNKNAKLDLIYKNPYLKEKFEECGYALHFNTTGLYMMIPIVYNNIYKGALGEKVGKFLLEQDGVVELLELDRDEFEKFDYKTSNGVYIDFKYFGESTGANTDIEKLISKSQKKLDKINGKKVIIINCFGDDSKHIKQPIIRGNISVYPFIINIQSQIDETIIEKIKEEINDAN
jgi:TorA maturation chaperone TorD